MEKLIMLLLLMGLASCERNDGVAENPAEIPDVEDVAHDMIVLGDKLEDPYSVKNVEAALTKVYPTKASRIDITPTNLYVRFLPASEEELQKLVDTGIDLLDHPVDYQIVKEGDYYHDPDLEDDAITWQYAAVSKDYEFPEGIEYEILDDCYIPENDISTRSDGIDWDEVMREAYRMTGNADMLEDMDTKADKEAPQGRITIVDEEINGGQPFGVAGVKVVCNTFVRFCSAYTDRDGYYSMSKKYSAKPRYRLMFKNKMNFCIGFNLILVPASFSTLGKGPSSGMDVTVTKDSETKLWCRCVVNNAGYDYISRCTAEDMGITAPPKKLRIWIFQSLSASSAVMMRQGAVIDNSLVKSFLGSYASLIKLFLPDITIGVKDHKSYSALYGIVCHEMSHASHFTQVGKTFWDKYIVYVISSFVASGGVTYGDGTGTGAGYCEVGEMWGYYMQNRMLQDRYSGSMPTVGLSYWFHPQIFRYLDERGLGRGQIFKALTSDVTSLSALKKKLLELYPEKSLIINQVFERYSNYE